LEEVAVAQQGLTSLVAAIRPESLGKLVLGAVLGGLIGWDREANGKPAGLRTNMLICIGATLIADLSIRFPDLSPPGPMRGDPARLVAQVVSGIGFLGAGTILQARGSVTGLTTAATLWVVAAIGIGVGSGAYLTAVATTALVLVTLVPLGMVEDHFVRKRQRRHLRLSIDDPSPDAVDELERFFEERGLVVETLSIERADAQGTSVRVDLRGHQKVFALLRRELVAHPGVALLAMEMRD
jgi:putative Mg2+ transporter-C (MgtC) family protein